MREFQVAGAIILHGSQAAATSYYKSWRRVRNGLRSIACIFTHQYTYHKAYPTPSYFENLKTMKTSLKYRVMVSPPKWSILIS